MRKADADYAADRDITHTSGSAEALAHLDSLMKK
jgi:aspartate/methionine/tyrosine aminotransferase